MSLAGRLSNRSRDLLFLPAFDRRWRRRCGGKVHCLLYHRVDRPGQVPFLDRFGVPPIPPGELAEELAFLQDRGAQFLTFADLRAGRFPAPDEFGVIVSFDDGFADNYRHGLPVLDDLGIRCTLFQSTALVEATTLIWEHALYWFGSDPRRAAQLRDAAHARIPGCAGREGDDLVTFLREEVPIPAVEELLAELRRTSGEEGAMGDLARSLYPRREDLVQAHCRGHEIGSHGHRHYPRRSLTAEAFEGELDRSRERLGQLLGEPPAAFSYPFDSHLPGDEAICGRHFEQVATVGGRPIEAGMSPLELPRFTWPGPHRHGLHRRRWLWTGRL